MSRKRYGLVGLLLLQSTLSLAAPITNCDELLFNGKESTTGKEVVVCKKGDYLDFFYGKTNADTTLHFDLPINQAGWGEDITRTGESHVVLTLLNGIEQYGVYFNTLKNQQEGGIIFYNEEGGREFIPLDIATVHSQLGPRLSDIGVAITRDY